MEKLTKAFHKRKKTNDAVRRLRGYYRMKCSFKLVCQGNEIKISKYGWLKTENKPTDIIFTRVVKSNGIYLQSYEQFNIL